MTDIYEVEGDDSASEYENSENELSSSPEVKRSRPLVSSSFRSRSQASLGKASRPSQANGTSTPDSGDEHQSLSRDSSLDRRIREEAIQWATNFVPPQSASEIKTPPRNISRGRQSKRKFGKAPIEIKVKRLRAYYNAQYRELLNADINDAVSQTVPLEKDPLQGSQIGASIWTSDEKESFFAALDRLGSFDLRGIAERVGTKSVLEIHEYIRILDEAVAGRREIDKGIPESRIWKDIPSAFEISEECNIILERAGDALATRQERHEEEVEKVKWGEAWLVNEAIAQRLSKRNQNGEDEEIFREALPAANLFNFPNWIELSKRVFMNPASPYEDENWYNIAENGEEPAVRATAFEDFHSLCVSVTKRLVSTVLFCTMSRQRAIASTNTKHADVNNDDVEAALQILGMRPDSHDFWVKCARRCKLRVIDPDETGTEDPISYDDVERSLKPEQRSRWRSRSRSRSVPSEVHGRSLTPSDSPESVTSDSVDEMESGSGDESSSSEDGIINLSDTAQASAQEAKQDAALNRAQARQEAERVQDRYIEAYDIEASRKDERNLWSLLAQDPPFDMEVESFDQLKDEALRSRRRREDDSRSWRERVEYWNAWEMFEQPVPEESFENNRKRVSGRARRRAERGGSEGPEEEEEEESIHHDVESVASVDEEGSESDELVPNEYESSGKEGPDISEEGGVEEDELEEDVEIFDDEDLSRQSSPEHIPRRDRESPSQEAMSDDSDDISIKLEE